LVFNGLCKVVSFLMGMTGAPLRAEMVPFSIKKPVFQFAFFPWPRVDSYCPIQQNLIKGKERGKT